MDFIRSELYKILIPDLADIIYEYHDLPRLPFLSNIESLYHYEESYNFFPLYPHRNVYIDMRRGKMPVGQIRHSLYRAFNTARTRQIDMNFIEPMDLYFLYFTWIRV